MRARPQIKRQNPTQRVPQVPFLRRHCPDTAALHRWQRARSMHQQRRDRSLVRGQSPNRLLPPLLPLGRGIIRRDQQCTVQWLPGVRHRHPPRYRRSRSRRCIPRRTSINGIAYLRLRHSMPCRSYCRRGNTLRNPHTPSLVLPGLRCSSRTPPFYSTE